MSTIDPASELSAEEYIRRREERIYEDDLANGSVYTFLGRLAVGGIEGLKLPSRVQIGRCAGEFLVSVVILDEDMNPEMTNRGQMRNGIWTAAPDDPFYYINEDASFSRLDEAYFLDYEDGLGLPTVAAAQAIKSPQELIGV